VAITTEELLAGAPLSLSAGSPLVDHRDVLRVSPEMEEFLKRHVARGVDPLYRLRQLSDAIINAGSLGLSYDETTRTAPEAFRSRRGNCLSFSSLFVAMARHVGLVATYQEVETPPDWTLRKDVFVLNRHVNVLVELNELAEDRVIDFNLSGFRSSYKRRPISDQRALAHHDNNLAVESLQAGDAGTAFRYLRRAVQGDPSFSPAWTNLGTLYLREGALEHARAAYLRALEEDGEDLVAMSNLARLYERAGDADRAASYRREVVGHRNRNPYYRAQLAKEALLAHDYDTAIRHLRYAVGRRRHDDWFCFLLGVSYFGQGNDAAARKWLQRAERIAASDGLKRRYAAKGGKLLSSPSP
jgi:Flp pilus assembly protein TadD